MIAESLKERLNILLQGDAISAETHRLMTLVGNWVESKGELFKTPSHIETFFTHMSMATDRMLKGEPLTDFDDADLDDVRDSGKWDEVMALYKELQGVVSIEYPDSEGVFLKIYLNLMLLD